MIAQVKGNLLSCNFSDNGRWVITFQCDSPVPLELKDDLQISLEKWREKRSIDQNSYLWSLIDQIASVNRTDRWSVYLKMLRDYGKVSYVVVDPRALDYLKATIRETEVLGEIEMNDGRKGIQVACYHGSSTLNTQEFARLLDGVVQEAKDLGIETLDEIRLKEIIRQNGKHNN